MTKVIYRDIFASVRLPHSHVRVLGARNSMETTTKATTTITTTNAINEYMPLHVNTCENYECRIVKLEIQSGYCLHNPGHRMQTELRLRGYPCMSTTSVLANLNWTQTAVNLMAYCVSFISRVLSVLSSSATCRCRLTGSSLDLSWPFVHLALHRERLSASFGLLLPLFPVHLLSLFLAFGVAC